MRRLLSNPKIQSDTFGTPPLPIPSSGSERPDSIEIDEIWLLDDIHHAASIDVNKGLIGPVHCWVDGGRDIVAAISQIIPKGSEKRVIGVGHSFGGNAM